jgi:hypothetical protein
MKGKWKGNKMGDYFPSHSDLPELHHYITINSDSIVQKKQIVSISTLRPQFQNPFK